MKIKLWYWSRFNHQWHFVSKPAHSKEDAVAWRRLMREGGYCTALEYL